MLNLTELFDSHSELHVPPDDAFELGFRRDLLNPMGIAFPVSLESLPEDRRLPMHV